jgi:hypothetical protein
MGDGLSKGIIYDILKGNPVYAQPESTLYITHIVDIVSQLRNAIVGCFNANSTISYFPKAGVTVCKIMDRVGYSGEIRSEGIPYEPRPDFKKLTHVLGSAVFFSSLKTVDWCLARLKKGYDTIK